MGQTVTQTDRDNFLKVAREQLEAFEDKERQFRKRVRKEREADLLLLAKDLKLQ